MPTPKCRLPASLLALFASLVPFARGEILPLANGGFENNLTGWTLSTTASVATSSYAHASLGLRGVRLKDTVGGQAYTFTSPSCAASAGQTYRVTAWARSLTTTASGFAVRVIFKNSAGQELAPVPTAGVVSSRNINDVVWFAKQTVRGVAPAGTASIAVVFESSSASGIGGVEIDDIEIVREVANEVLPSKYQAYLLEIGGNPSRGKAPPKIVLKLDDLKTTNGVLSPNFDTISTYLAGQQVEHSFGVICASLGNNPPAAYTNWIKQRATGGWTEFWHHGVDHLRKEFDHDPAVVPTVYTGAAAQVATLDAGNDLAFDALGVRFKTLGTPENAFNHFTHTALSQDPDIKVWLYGNLNNPGGKVVLGRATNVNLESPTFVPNHEAFIEGYAHNRGSAYFVLQGHPGGWINGSDQTRFTEFKRTIAFLKRADINASFVFPSSFAP